MDRKETGRSHPGTARLDFAVLWDKFQSWICHQIPDLGSSKTQSTSQPFFSQEKDESEEKFPFLPSIRAKSHLPGMGTGLSWWEAEFLHKYPFLNVYFTVPHLNFNFQNILQYLRNWDSSNVGFYT